MHIQTQICKKSGLINAHSNPNMQKKWFNQCKFIFEYAEKVNLNSSYAKIILRKFYFLTEKQHFLVFYGVGVTKNWTTFRVFLQSI
jgi:hypothetical protein